MRIKYFASLLLVTALTSCTKGDFVLNDKVFCFDTIIEAKLFEGEQSDIDEIHNLCVTYDKLTDNYKTYEGITNISSINTTNKEIEINPRLYDILKISRAASAKGANNYNILCGGLAKAWKDALSAKEILSDTVIQEELNKINNSDLLFFDNNIVQRVGEAEIDLGGVAKGYVLDEIYGYLSFRGITHYLINGGSSSILLGEKESKDGLFNVGIDSKIIPNRYMKLKNCFVSTSAVSVQGVQLEEDGPIYSHIINPKTGSAINEQDAVIVVSDSGYLGDILSTSMMMNTLEEIKEIEKEQDVKCIVIKDKEITYVNEELEVLYR